MIPEAYWKLIWHWWWLIVLLMVLGAGGAYYLSKLVIIHESSAALEVTRVIDANGILSYDEFERRVQANLWADQLRGSWVTARLSEELQSAGMSASSLNDMSIQVTAPSRSKTTVGPAIIEIDVQHPVRSTAQRIAETASQVYASYIIERQEEFLAQRRQEVEIQVNQLEQRLRSVLGLKRDAINEEALRAQEAGETILEANERLLAQMPVLLDDFRRQIGIANVGLAADTQTLDATTASLRLEIEELRSEWQTNLRPSLATLYAADAQPEYQLAVIQERPIQLKYEESLRTLNTLSDNISPNVVTVLETGTRPSLVSAIGLRTRFLLLGGGVAGLVVGWILANLGEYLLLVRSRRKAAQIDADVMEREREMSPV